MHDIFCLFSFEIDDTCSAKKRIYREIYKKEDIKKFDYIHRINLTMFESSDTNNPYFSTLVLTSPGKKQQCFRSMCLPKLICSKVSRICRVSMISDSHAKG